MAKTNMTITGAMFLMPITANFAVSHPNSAIRVPIIGTKIKADRALTFLKRTSTSNSIVTPIPIKGINFQMLYLKTRNEHHYLL